MEGATVERGTFDKATVERGTFDKATVEKYGSLEKSTVEYVIFETTAV